MVIPIGRVRLRIGVFVHGVIPALDQDVAEVRGGFLIRNFADHFVLTGASLRLLGVGRDGDHIGGIDGENDDTRARKPGEIVIRTEM